MYLYLSTKVHHYIFQNVYATQANETLEDLGSIRARMVADRSNFEGDMAELEDYLMFMGDQKKRVEQDISNKTEEKNRLVARNSQRSQDEFADLLRDVSELDVDQIGTTVSGSVIDTFVQPLVDRGIKLVGEENEYFFTWVRINGNRDRCIPSSSGNLTNNLLYNRCHAKHRG